MLLKKMREWWDLARAEKPEPMTNISRLPRAEKREVWELIKSTDELMEVFEHLLVVANYFDGEIQLRSRDLETKTSKKI